MPWSKIIILIIFFTLAIISKSLAFFSNLSLSDVADLSNAIIAIVNVCLAYYIFFRQTKINNSNNLQTAQLNERNIRLQWFKELIIQPNLANIFNFYNNLNHLRVLINTQGLDKIALMEHVKKEGESILHHFANSLQKIEPQMYIEAKRGIDSLTDTLTLAIDDDVINLQDEQIYDHYIERVITNAKNDMLALIYNYKGN